MVDIAHLKCLLPFYRNDSPTFLECHSIPVSVHGIATFQKFNENGAIVTPKTVNVTVIYYYNMSYNFIAHTINVFKS